MALVCTIKSKEYRAPQEGETFAPYWYVSCYVDGPDGTRSGYEAVYLPETATDEEIQAAIVAMYMPKEA